VTSPTSTWLRDKLRQRIRLRAAKERRSFSQVVSVLLEDALDRRDSEMLTAEQVNRIVDERLAREAAIVDGFKRELDAREVA
jgi:hypothetical protein